jgi:MFS family permease
VFLAVITIGMTVGHRNLLVTYAYMGVSMLVRAVANPLFYSMISASTGSEEREQVFTGVNSVSSVSLVLSPALGGVVSENVGLGWLFAIDALSFIAGVGLLVSRTLHRSGRQAESAGRGGAGNRGLFRWLSKPPGSGPLLTPALWTWFLFILVGAVLNAVEMPVFDHVLHYSDSRFGLALSSFGLGGVLALALSLTGRRLSAPTVASALMFLLGLALWLSGVGALPFIGFGIAGLASALAAGSVRAALSGRAEREGIEQQKLWGWVNQSVLLGNLIVYLAASILFAAEVPLTVMLVALFGVGAAWVAAAVVLARSEQTLPVGSEVTEDA